MKKTKRATKAKPQQPAPQPWDEPLRNLKKKAIDKAAQDVARKIGARFCVIVAFFPANTQGDSFHIMDGGHSPMPSADLYRTMHGAAVRVGAGQEGWNQ